MSKRKSISKKIRFEVFKRDKFTCQYCGRKSPDVILEIDHIEPVSKGGDNEIINLVTSCKDCNSGKRDIPLDDSSIIQKQRKQLEEIQERRQQMEMMLQWRRTLDNFDDEKLELICEYFNEKIFPFSLSDNGRNGVQKILNKFEISRVLDSIDIAVKKYLHFDEHGKPLKESVELAIDKLGGILHFEKLSPIKQKLAYIKGICRNRFNYWDNKIGSIILNNFVEALQNKGWDENTILNDLDTEVIKVAKESKNWSEWRNRIEGWIDDINSWKNEKTNDYEYDNLDVFQYEEVEKNISNTMDLLQGYYDAIKVFVNYFPDYDEGGFKTKVKSTIKSLYDYSKSKINEINEFYSLSDQEIVEILNEQNLLSFTYSYLNTKNNRDYYLTNAILKMTIIFLSDMVPSSAFGISRKNQFIHIEEFYNTITA